MCDYDGKMKTLDILGRNAKGILESWIAMSWDDDTIWAWKGEFTKRNGIPYGRVWCKPPKDEEDEDEQDD